MQIVRRRDQSEFIEASFQNTRFVLHAVVQLLVDTLQEGRAGRCVGRPIVELSVLQRGDEATETVAEVDRPKLL